MRKVSFFWVKVHTFLSIGAIALRGGSRISKGGVDGRPYLLRGGRENALTKKIGNNKFYLYLFTPCFLISKYSPDVVQL